MCFSHFRHLIGCAMLAGCTPTHSRPFTFVQMCDPQIGFNNYEADLARFRQAVKQINALKPDFVVICGDLVHVTNAQSFADFNSATAELTVPCYCAAGNHDFANRLTPETLRRYRQLIGRDYYSFEHKGCTFVVANSQLWKTPVAGESGRQDAWFKETLEAAAQRRRPVFIVCHHPLFAQAPDEAEDYLNLPLAKREELLELFGRCGVVAVLAGHTHQTKAQEFMGIQMVTSQTTSRNLDNEASGFRLWHVGPARPYQNEFVPLKE